MMLKPKSNLEPTTECLNCRKIRLGILLVVFVVVCLFCVDARKDKGKRSITIARLNEVANCNDRPLRPCHMTHAEIIVPAKNRYSLYAEAINEKATRSIEKVIANITKCDDRSKSNCEHFQRLEWKGGNTICPLIKLPNSPWECIFKEIHPPFKCDYPKTKIIISNVTLDQKALMALFASGKSYWILQAEIYDETLSPWACSRVELDYPTVRV